MKPKQAETLGDVLQQYLKAIGAEKRMQEIRVLNCWEEVVGKNISRYVRNISFKDGVFTASFQSTIIKNELSMRRTAIMERLNELAGEDLVKKIEIK